MSTIHQTDLRRLLYKKHVVSVRQRKFTDDRDAVGWIFVALFSAVILVVAINDVYWSFKTQDVLYEEEQNPLGRWLIELDNGDIALFMTAKMLGTMAVISALPFIYAVRRRVGEVVAGVLALFQVMLFLYLNFGDIFPIFAWM